MMEWFRNLSDGNKIAIIIPVIVAVITGLIGLFIKLFSKKNTASTPTNEIDQSGSENTAIIAEDNKGNIAARDINMGIEPDNILDRNQEAYIQLGQSKEIIKNKDAKIEQLEEQLALSQLPAEPGESQVPQPTTEAKEIAAQIEDDAGPYAQALKAIAEGSTEQADELLDETRQTVDAVQEKKDLAQAKIYLARMQNVSDAGKPQDALQYCEELTTLAGNDPLILNEIANVYCENAQYPKAEPLYIRALAINEVRFGKDHPKTSRALNNLAQLYQATNRLKEAEPLMERVVEIFEKAYGKGHLNVAAALNNLAQLYQDTNRLTEAEPLLKRALEIDEASLGKDHPDVAIALNNLAQLYQDTNRLAEAEPLMVRTLKISEASYGKSHPNVATRLNNLAHLYKATNRLAEAEPLYERAMAIDEASFGKSHPKVAIRLNNLAMLYDVTNRPAEAEPLMERALEIDQASFGKSHPKVAIRLNNLAGLYQATNRLKKAEPLSRRHLEIFIDFTRKTGHQHPHLMDAANNYAVILVEMGDSEEQARAKVNAMAPDLFGEKK